MWIEVTIERCDVRGAKRGWCSNCPAARCLNRHLDPMWRAFVVFTGWIKNEMEISVIGTSKLTEDGGFDIKDTEILLKAPADLAEYVIKYDKSKTGRPPKPITFKINIPKKYLRKEVAA